MWFNEFDFLLVPVFDSTVPASCEHFAGLMRMPQHRDADSVVRFPLLI